ncbi:MAG: prolipoprotein diacylglyceryl transferase [Bacteroidales bacterium]|jgi:prolipoprotein diacylglyceryl transferase|nr:prolipoprotein diacylglyceryl transferase [Bacteroidales bacterium]
MNLILTYINWTVDPVIFSIGSFSVRWYGFLLALGFFLAYLTLQKVFKFENLSQQLTDKLAIWTVIWTLVGLRLGHFLFYEPEFFIKAPLEVFFPIDSHWNFVGFQGLASHGGVLAIILFIIYFAWKHKMNFLWLIDRLAVVVMIAAAFVRIGNLMNHEIVGSITTSALAFNFTKGGPGVAGTLRHPAQLYEAIVYFITYFSLVFYYFKIAKGNVPPGRVVGSLLIVVFTSRFIIEFFKEVQVTKETGMTLDIGQWLSIPFVVLGIACLIYSIIHKNNIPHYIEKPVKKNNNNKKN